MGSTTCKICKEPAHRRSCGHGEFRRISELYGHSFTVADYLADRVLHSAAPPKGEHWLTRGEVYEKYFSNGAAGVPRVPVVVAAV